MVAELKSTSVNDPLKDMQSEDVSEDEMLLYFIDLPENSQSSSQVIPASPTSTEVLPSLVSSISEVDESSSTTTTDGTAALPAAVGSSSLSSLSHRPASPNSEQLFRRRQRNREHARRTRARKKIEIEGMKEKMCMLETQLNNLKKAIQREWPDKAGTIISQAIGSPDSQGDAENAVVPTPAVILPKPQ